MINHRFLVRLIYSTVVFLCILATVALVIVVESKQYVFEHIKTPTLVNTEDVPFPVSVDPQSRTIKEIDQVVLLEGADAVETAEQTDATWLDRVFALFADQNWYQNLATPISRVVVIWPGERKEEAAKNIGDVLRWDATERAEFISLVTTTEPIIPEGTFYPDRYVAHRNATPQEVATMINTTFKEQVLTRYTPEVESVVPLADALTIASLLEREASDFENMREVAGVIWNRLFIDMPLQLDATLQYARGSRPTEPDWWPVPQPRDKFIESAYNTYANQGLPPAPIANPSSAAVLAALNPIPTDCLFYFHGPEQDYYCSVTYDEHVRKLRIAYNI
jgi:cell division protein YceG involved in septum cleavage